MNRFNKTKTTGFTLVEILVVLVIATVVLSLAIPRIRTINKERTVREAARVVGSKFANASQRASIDGIAGVRITRNANFFQGTFQYAATEVSTLRAVPSFTGDQQDSEITDSDETAGTVDIDEPLEQSALGIIQRGDSISFNHSSIKYLITDIDGIGTGTLELELDRGEGDYLPIPEYDASASSNPSYVVHRLPRLLRSSVESLPDNHIIDLRFSGFEVLDDGDSPTLPRTRQQLTRVFEPVLILSGTINYTIDFIFDGEGSVDRVIYRDSATGNSVAARLPLGPIFFFITEAPNSVAMTDEVAAASETGLWVTVSNSTGTTNIGYNNSLAAANFTYQTLTDYYNGTYDADTIPEMDRDHFNEIISDCRDNSVATSANQ
ncbi:pilus assembly FimT family protein [Mariniblastus fucicola]|uniref:Uncharacterized protein n=1 Tax=Mariniblastus fucicola TaxID=980251 RepID=A0A5B9P366_9BACT|nr:type II secretion system protein [Mariniblastus fucicola]QEG20614.1 hypothetical protein MFFC18_04640 [Mariniblastus fucicola]